MLYNKYLLLAAVLLSSCARNSDDVWEDTKSASRHMQRGVSALFGHYGDSRQVHSKREFEGIDEECYQQNYPEFICQEFDDTSSPPSPAHDYIPLPGAESTITSSFPPPREMPGEMGSQIPGIQAFRDPATLPHLCRTFTPIYFDYDSSLIRGKEPLHALEGIALYLKQHPHTYLFIEGHTDERGAQAYNLALGSRRANAVRHHLINLGVNPDTLFTISYGKERPAVIGRHEEGWSKNRRAEFKIYER